MEAAFDPPHIVLYFRLEFADKRPEPPRSLVHTTHHCVPIVFPQSGTSFDPSRTRRTSRSANCPSAAAEEFAPLRCTQKAARRTRPVMGHRRKAFEDTEKHKNTKTQTFMITFKPWHSSGIGPSIAIRRGFVYFSQIKKSSHH